jgi:hypothetical protein
MRAFAMLIAVIATLAGSYGALTAVRAVGPDDQTDNYGYGDAATTSPGGGDLYQSQNFARVVTALRRELGDDGAVQNLSLKRGEANVIATVDGRMVYVDVDASGRSQRREGDAALPAGRTPVSRLDAGAIDKLVRASQRESHALVEGLTLAGGTREWTVDMADGGEPDSFIANLDGGGLRISGEPNPEPIGAAPDSMLRAANLERVLTAARKEAPEGRVTSVDVRPDRVSIELDTGGRTLSLNVGYDAQLTSRGLQAKTGVDDGAVRWRDLDPGAPERMLRSARRLLHDVKGLQDVQYVLLSLPSPGTAGGKPGLLMYFSEGHKTGYVVADLHGRKVTWPGRS